MQTRTCPRTWCLRSGVHIVAPCPHDGHCPLENSGKYCHFQHLQRTTSQCAYKHLTGEPLRGFEDEKFSFVAFIRGQRPRESWPLDGKKFETLKEQHAKRNPEDLEIDHEDLLKLQAEVELVPYEKKHSVNYDVDVIEYDAVNSDKDQDEKGEEETSPADLRGWLWKDYLQSCSMGKTGCDGCLPVNQKGWLRRLVSASGLHMQ